ncbi:CBU_0585 family protein [Pleionea sediminis]|uniref:CBU_0585 family protein n=1 Tax=Pleionea sediminis TaxID=2569479 RepID=UPI0011848396|nr:CBU_0585 family protein [Pleionea sediminis]
MAIDRNYVSEMDKFLKEFDEKPESHSESRRAEEEKYKKIHDLRDNQYPERQKSKIWKDF